MDQTSTIYLKVLTPESELFSDVASMVVAPGASGEIGVLPGHMNLATTLSYGLVRIYHPHESTFKLFISGGIAHFESDNMQILAEYATDISEQEAEQLYGNLEELKQKYSNYEEDDKAIISEEIELTKQLLECLENENKRKEENE